MIKTVNANAVYNENLFQEITINTEEHFFKLSVTKNTNQQNGQKMWMNQICC